MAKKQRSNQIANKIPYWVEAFVVKLSLQHPDYGTKRLLPLLEQEGIILTSSAVYTILKRNNLQNRTLRLSRLEEERAAANFSEPIDWLINNSRWLSDQLLHRMSARRNITSHPK